MLEAIVKHQIEKNGAIPLGQYIEIALSHPEHGYYMTRDPLGKRGDFTTAPEISQIFGELIGAWIIDIWAQMGKPALNLIECGPGRGTLMADIVRIIRNFGGVNNNITIHMIETSPALIEKQKQALKSINAQWHSHILSVPSDSPVLIVANEFLDALPVEQLRRADQGWMQKYIGIKDGALTESWQPAPHRLQTHLPPKTRSGKIYEISPVRSEYISNCADLIAKTGGAALFIDYGHAKTHHGDTVQAIKNHKYSDILKEIGHSDITSHVDFEAARNAASAQGLNISPIVTQGAFLNKLGGAIRCKALINAAKNKTQANDIQKGYQRVAHNDEMGDLFKVLCFYKGDLNPAGF